MEIIKKEIFSWKFLYILTIFGFVSIFLMFLFNMLISSGELSYSILEFMLVIFGLSSSANYFHKYGNEKITKYWYLQGKSRLLLDMQIIFTVFLMMVFITIIWVFLLLLFNYFLLWKPNLFISIASSDVKVFNNGSGSVFFWYSIFLESFFIIISGFFLNSIFKKNIFIYGIIIFISVYSILHGNIFGNIIIKEDNFLKLNSKYNNFFTSMNFWIINPWSQVGTVSRTSISTYGTDINFWDFSSISANNDFPKIYNYLWLTPYLYIFSMSGFVILKRYIKKEPIAN